MAELGKTVKQVYDATHALRHIWLILISYKYKTIIPSKT